MAALLYDLYRIEWSRFRNFFCPVMKHLRTESKGSRKQLIYDQPATPLARLKACPQANPVLSHFSHNSWPPRSFQLAGSPPKASLSFAPTSPPLTAQAVVQPERTCKPSAVQLFR